MSEAAVLTQIANYLDANGAAGGTGGDGTIPFLNVVFPYPPKFTPEGDVLPADLPGVSSGAVIYLYIPQGDDVQIEFRGKDDPGGKRVKYDCHMVIVFMSEKQETQDVGADAVAFKDGLKTAIRASKNCGGDGPIFQWGQGDTVGGIDIQMSADLPKLMNGKQGKSMVYMLAKVTVIELLNA